MSAQREWIDAPAAARLLGVSRATLYAYVSRGFVRSQLSAGTSRRRTYARDDVERLRRRTEERKNPDQAAARALHWGMPILESSIAMMDGHALYYRGHDAVQLSRSRTLREVASLIWSGGFDLPLPDPSRAGAAVNGNESGLPFIPLAQSRLASAATHDALALDLRAGAVAQTGWRILHLLASLVAPMRRRGESIDERIARAWKVSGRGTPIVRAALILCADHELNVSSFTARCVASAGSHPYAVVIAGLAALEGPKHGGASARVEAMITALRRSRTLRADMAERLRRGDRLEGFGHPLYRHGDPRAIALLDLLRASFGGSNELAFLLDLASVAGELTGDAPNIDFALASVARVLRLPPRSPLTLFAVGRTIGWIGHAIEQYATDQLIRPRAKYVGVAPNIEQRRT
jgi:citrate synthase